MIGSVLTGQTPIDFKAAETLIDDYIRTNTPASFPVVAKTFGVYLKAFLAGEADDGVQAALDLNDSYYDPFRVALVNRFLFPSLVNKIDTLDLSQVNSNDAPAPAEWDINSADVDTLLLHLVIVYSRARKDDALYRAMVGAFFDWRDVFLVYGDAFRPASVSALDILEEAHTDQGYTTDMVDVGTPRYMAVVKYPYEAPINFSMERFVAKVRALADFAAIVTPARLFFGIIMCPEFKYQMKVVVELTDKLDPSDDRYTDQGHKTDALPDKAATTYGFTVARSPFILAEDLAQIQALDDDDVEGIYNIAVSDADAIVSQVGNAARVKKFVVSSSAPIRTLTVSCGVEGSALNLSDFAFEFPDAERYRQVMMLPVYYIQMDIVFP